MDTMQLGHFRRLRLTHTPSGVSVETEGDGVPWKTLKAAARPKLRELVGEWQKKQRPRDWID